MSPARKTFEVVLVEWVDACSHSSGWRSLEEMAKCADQRMEICTYTVGFLVSKNDKRVVLAMAIDIPDGEDLPQVTDGFSIPYGLIRNMTVLKRVGQGEQG